MHERHAHHHGSTPLLVAAEAGQVEAARLLLDEGAAVDARNRWETTALHVACLRGHEGLVALLLARGADTRLSRDGYGLSGLMCAAWTGSVGAVRQLLLHGEARVDERSSNGRTAIWLAATRGHSEAVWTLLLEGGADPGVSDEEGVRPWQAAWSRGHHELARDLQVRRSSRGRPSSS